MLIVTKEQAVAAYEKAMAEYEIALAAFKALWPNLCVYCMAQGGSYYDYDPSPAGVCLGSGSMTDFEPCPKCECQNKCPRCAGEWSDEIWDGDVITCPHCGWSDKDVTIEGMAAPVMPEPYEFEPEYDDRFDDDGYFTGGDCYDVEYVIF